MGTTLADQEAALRTKAIIERAVLKIIDRERPTDKYGVVTSITPSARTAAVRMSGSTDSVNVNMGAVQPTSVGQVVRVGGTVGDRWIINVIGAAAVVGAPVGDLATPEDFAVYNLAGVLSAHWAATEAGSYHLQVCDADDFELGAGITIEFYTPNTRFLVDQLTIGVTYYVRVRAVNGDVGSPWSPVLPFISSGLTASLTDGQPPADSPDVTCTAGLGWVLAEWAPQANDDQVTYEVYASSVSGFTPSPATKLGETTGTFYTVRRFADDTPLSYQHNVFVRVIAKDADGPSPIVGAQGFAKPSQVELGDVGNTINFNTGDGKAPGASPTTLVITSGIGFLYAKWDHVENLDAVTYELHIATSAVYTPTAASLVGETPANFAFIRQLPSNLGGGPLDYATTYYVSLWAKDNDGYAPDPSAVVATNTVRATQLDFADLSIGQAQIIDASIGSAQIADLAVDNAKISDAAITSAKIQNLAVGTAKIAGLAVTNALIADLAVDNAKIANLAVDNAKIANLAVSTAKIQDLAVTNALIADLAVDTAKIAALAVTNAQIADLSADKLTAGTIDASIISVINLNADNITAGTISADNISGGTLDANTITVNNLNANSITAGTLNVDRIADLSVSGSKIQNGGIGPSQIGNSAVGPTQIATNAVTNSAIGPSAVGVNEIQNYSVTNAKIGNSAVGTAQIQDLAVNTSKIQDATITNAKIQSLDAAKITTGYLNADRIQGGTITGVSISGVTITGGTVQTSTSGKRVSLGGTYVDEAAFYYSGGLAARLYGAGGGVIASTTALQTNSYMRSLGQFFSGTGSSGGPAYTFSAATSTGMYRSNTNEVSLVAGGNISILCASSLARFPLKVVMAGLTASSTTAGEPIWHYNGGGDEVIKHTSTGRLKINQRPKALAESLAVLNLQPRVFDPLMEEEDGTLKLAGAEEKRNDEKFRGQLFDQTGLIAEEVAVDFPEAAIYDTDGNPANVDWDAVTVSLLQVVQALYQDVERQETLIASLALLVGDPAWEAKPSVPPAPARTIPGPAADAQRRVELEAVERSAEKALRDARKKELREADSYYREPNVPGIVLEESNAEIE